jgi:hypothetical protein
VELFPHIILKEWLKRELSGSFLETPLARLSLFDLTQSSLNEKPLPLTPPTKKKEAFFPRGHLLKVIIGNYLTSLTAWGTVEETID